MPLVLQRKSRFAKVQGKGRGIGRAPKNSKDEESEEDEDEDEHEGEAETQAQEEEEQEENEEEEEEEEEADIEEADRMTSVTRFRERHRITVQLHMGAESPAVNIAEGLSEPVLSFEELDLRNVPAASRDVCRRFAATSAQQVATPTTDVLLRPTAVQAECWGWLLMPSETIPSQTPQNCKPVPLPVYTWELSVSQTPRGNQWHEAEAIAIPSDDESDESNGISTCKVRDTHDVIAIAPTGSGKTLAYLLPLVVDGLCSAGAGTLCIEDVFDHFEKLFPSSFPLERGKNVALLEQVRKLREHKQPNAALSFLRQVSKKAQEGTNKAKVAEWHRFSDDCFLVGLSLPRALVLLPTRELALQVAQVAQAFRGVSCRAVIGGVDPDRQREQVLAELPSLVIATPGRLCALCGQIPSSTLQRQLEKDGTRPEAPARSIALARVSRLVLDEGDRLLDEGFEDDIQALANLAVHRRLTMLFSATWSSPIQSLSKVLRSGAFHISAEGLPKSILQRVEYLAKAARGRRLRELLQEFGTAKVLVFVLYQEEARGLAKMLVSEGWSAWALQGKMSQAARSTSLQSFRTEKQGILVATDVAARGLDVAGVTHVVNFSFGLSVDTYVHRIGRCGRAGHKGTAVTFVTDGDQRHCPALLQVLRQSHQNVPEWLIDLALSGESNRSVDNSRKPGQPSEEELEARQANAEKQERVQQRRLAKQAQELCDSNIRSRRGGRQPLR